MKYSYLLRYVTSQENVKGSTAKRDTPWCSYCVLLAAQLGHCCLGGTVKLEWWTTIYNKGTYVFV